MNPSTLAVASDFVKSGIEKAGIPLTENLEAYLSITFARFMDLEIMVDRLSVRVIEAMDANAPRETIRYLADECIIACSFFEDRLRRNGSVRHYVGLGQMSYDSVGMTEQAYGFTQMRDVMACAADCGRRDESDVLIDRARSGSTTAREQLADQSVIVGPWGNGSGNGLLWN